MNAQQIDRGHRENWAFYRETSVEIVDVIFGLWDDPDTRQRVWESPTENQSEYIVSKASRGLPEGTQLYWGVETFTVGESK